MKKILISIVALVFCIAAANAEPTTNNAVDYVKQQLTNKADAESILEKLTSSEYNMSLNDAVNMIINNGGNEINARAAANIINPDYIFTKVAIKGDPTAGLDPSASGDDGNTTTNTGPNNLVATGAGTTTGGFGGIGGFGGAGGSGGGAVVSP